MLTCPRDGAPVVELKTPATGADVERVGTPPVVTGWWCEVGHKLDESERPIEVA